MVGWVKLLWVFSEILSYNNENYVHRTFFSEKANWVLYENFEVISCKNEICNDRTFFSEKARWVKHENKNSWPYIRLLGHEGHPCPWLKYFNTKKNNNLFLTLTMLRLILSPKAQGCKDFWKPSQPCHVGIHWIAFNEYSQMSTHVLGFRLIF